jgi:hypothetical protein
MLVKRGDSHRYLFDSPSVIRETTQEHRTTELSPVPDTRPDKEITSEFDIALQQVKSTTFNPRKITEVDDETDQMPT